MWRSSSGWCQRSCGNCSAGGAASSDAAAGRQPAPRDREVLAAIIFVATKGCTWQLLPPVFGPSGPTVQRRSTDRTAARARTRPHPPGAGRAGFGAPAMPGEEPAPPPDDTEIDRASRPGYSCHMAIIIDS
ncbi:transposase [Actinomadura sp. KC06]|nr:transposase [Actinomadura sp. KC06]